MKSRAEMERFTRDGINHQAVAMRALHYNRKIIKDIIRLKIKGKTLKEIAALYPVSQQRIEQIIYTYRSKDYQTLLQICWRQKAIKRIAKLIENNKKLIKQRRAEIKKLKCQLTGK